MKLLFRLLALAAIFVATFGACHSLFNELLTASGG